MAYESGLFKWERITKPRFYSRTQRLTSNNDIQDWIQKVEHASNKAASETFGTKYVPPRKVKNESVKNKVEDAHIYEAAYSEAQDLLNEWVKDKIKLDNDFDDYNEESWVQKTQMDVKQEWDRLLSDDADLELDEYKTLDSSICKRRETDYKDPYAILKKDDSELVNEILDDIWEKDFISDNFKQNLDLETPKTYDPTTKMKLRQQQVKENREKRLQEKEKKFKELQLKKESQFRARQILLKEEKNRTHLKRKEEEEIQKEMAKIKREMEEEKKRHREEAIKRRQEEEEFSRRATVEVKLQENEELKKLRSTQYHAEEKRRTLLKKIKEIETRRETENMKLLQRCFSSWYQIVLERRLAIGKAKATADWKLLLRTFNSWKAYTRAKQMEKQAFTHEENQKDIHRKNNMAVSYYKYKVLSKCMTAWQLYVSQQQTERCMEENRAKTKNKMALFLEAAATGKLCSEKKASEKSVVHDETEVQKVPSPDVITVTSKETEKDESCGQERKLMEIPTVPWQVTRKHLQLTKKELKLMGTKAVDKQNEAKICICSEGAQMGEKNIQCPACLEVKLKENANKQVKKIWERPAYHVNNYEHRHAAQQKILEMQQKQIKEQQRLIEELQYLQRQQLLQQKLLQEQQAKKLPDSDSIVNTETIQNTLSQLQEHILKLQQQIVNGSDDSKESDFSSNTINVDINEDNNHPYTKTAKDKVGDSCNNSNDMKLDLTSIDDSNVASQKTKRTSKMSAKIVKSPYANEKSEVQTASSTARTLHPRHTQFLKTMEERAAERSAIKKDREEKRRMQEELKLAQIMAEEEKRKLEEAELKQQKIEEHRAKKRLEKQKEKEKQIFQERMKKLTVKADEQRQRALLKYRGWKPWRRLIENLREKEELAETHYNHVLLRNCLTTWNVTVIECVEKKNHIANQFNNYRTVKHAFLQWKQVKHCALIQEQKAVHHYENKLKRISIRKMADFAAEEKVSLWHKERRAAEHNLLRVRKKYFNLWRYMPIYRKEEEEKEKRKMEMRKKVAHLLPDFKMSNYSEDPD